jgi:integrase/recombinase XerC
MGGFAAPQQGDCMDMIEAYTEHLRRTSRSASEATVERRREVLAQLDRQLTEGLDNTSQQELEDWLHNGRDTRGGANRPWSQNTKATYYSAIRSAYAFWADPRDPWISEDPTVDIAPVHGVKGTARDITDDQLWEILARAREPYRLWALIAAYQGLRCIEISGLDREHVTRERLIVVRGKGGKPRVHDTDPMVWAAVEDLPRGPVARDIWGRERASRHYISRMAGRHFQDELGLEDVTMHRLRHWLGVRTQALYRDVRVTQEVLGHETLSATQIYTKATVEQQREARAMLPRPRVG